MDMRLQLTSAVELRVAEHGGDISVAIFIESAAGREAAVTLTATQLAERETLVRVQLPGQAAQTLAFGVAAAPINQGLREGGKGR